MTTQDLITTALNTGDRFITVAAEGKRGAYKTRQNVKRAARRMGVDDRLMVWAEHGRVYIARRAQ